MDWTSMFKVVLSEKNEEKKILKKTARVIFGIGVLKKGNGNKGNKEKFVFPLIDIRNYGPGTNCGVSLSLPEFEWFISSIKREVEHSTYKGHKDLIMNRIRSDNTISICSIVSDRCYGLVLDQNEIKKLSENVVYLSFLLKYRRVSGDKLKDITKAIYTSTVFEGIKDAMRFKCDECLGDEPNMDLHYCKKDFRNLRERSDILETVTKDPIIDGKFISIFQKVMEMLHINKYDRTEQMNIFWPEFKANKAIIEDEIRHHIEGNNGLTHTINVVMEGIPNEKLEEMITDNNN